MKLPKNTGTENPATAQRTEVISHSQTRPVAASAGSFSRKIPSDCPVYAGQYVAGEADQVKITTGKSSPGKQTWKGAREGYTTRSLPAYTSSPEANGAGMRPGGQPYTGRSLDTANISTRGVGPEQDVKDHTRNAMKHGGEAKQVAGQRNAKT
jgi:hypothetical protein